MSTESIVYEFARFCEFMRTKTQSELSFCATVVKHVTYEFAEDPPTASQEETYTSLLTKPGHAEDIVGLLEPGRGSMISGANSTCERFRESRGRLKKELALWPTNPEALLVQDVVDTLSGIALAPLRQLGTPHCVNLDFYRGTVPFRSYSRHVQADGTYIDDINEDARSQEITGRYDEIFVNADLFSWMFPTTLEEEGSPYALFRHPLRPYEIYWMQRDRSVMARATLAIRAMRSYFGICSGTVLSHRSREWGSSRSEFTRAAERFNRVASFAHLLGLEAVVTDMVRSVASAARTDEVCAKLLVQYMPEQFDIGTHSNAPDEEDEGSSQMNSRQESSATGMEPPATGTYPPKRGAGGGLFQRYSDPYSSNFEGEGSN